MQAAIESAGRLAERWSRVLRHPLGRQILPLGVGLWLAVDLVQVLGPLNFAAILNGVAAIEPQNWLGALVLTAVSFWAVSGYDVAVGHFLKINLPAKVLARSGAVATALAQLLGFGLVSGSLTRWRMLRCATVPLWRTSLLTGLVSLGFLCGVMVPVAVSVLLDGGLPEPARALAVFCLGVTILILILLMLRPGLPFGLHLSNLPPIGFALRLISLASLDAVAAGLAFFLLLPATDLTVVQVLPVFLLALSAGILSGTPAGFGPFELVFLTLTPPESHSAILTAILAFRAVYYAVPGVVAMVVLAVTEWRDAARAETVEPIHEIGENAARLRPFRPLLDRACRAEAALLGQGTLDLLPTPDGRAAMMVAQSENCLIALADPLGAYAARAGAIEQLAVTAARQNKIPCLYKCDAATAALAVQRGFRAHRIGLEAIVDPVAFSVQGRAGKTLRRKLANAQRSGVRVTRCMDATAHLAAMQQISRQWANRRGGERGFSMARFTPQSLARYHFHLAWQNDILVGFIGIWHGQAVRGLDLMRQSDTAPDGTMALLVQDAIAAAATAGIHRLSLSSVPFAGLDRPASPVELLCRRLFLSRTDRHGAQGLFQFKNSFRPDWEPLFLCLPRASLGLTAGLDLHRLIRPEFQDADAALGRVQPASALLA